MQIGGSADISDRWIVTNSPTRSANRVLLTQSGNCTGAPNLQLQRMVVGTKPLSGLRVSRNQADRRGRIVLDLHVIRAAQIRGDPDSLSAANHGVIRRAMGNRQIKPRGRQHARLPRLTGVCETTA